MTLRRLRIAQDESLPKFLSNYNLDERLTLGAMNKIFMVDGISTGAYVQRLSRNGFEFEREKVPHPASSGYKYIYRMGDIIAKAVLDGSTIAPSKVAQSVEIHESLKKEHEQLLAEVAQLKAKKAELVLDVSRLVGNLSDLSPMLKQTKFSLIPKEILIDKSKCYGSVKTCGIYFLIKDNEIVYIGQSVNIASRVADHTGKDFDSVSYVACEQNKLDILESLYILAYQPKLNGMAGVRPSTPISLNRIINTISGG